MSGHWLCCAATVRGDRSSNQDQVVVVDGAAAVPDGATSWLRDPDDDISAVTLMSDGAAAAVTEYGLAGWPDVIPELTRQGAGPWLAHTHAKEATDPDGRRWPRTKRHDDKSLVLLSRLG